MFALSQKARLISGQNIPLIGFGTQGIEGQPTVHNVIHESFRVGFRSIDTSPLNGNEDEIGRALTMLLPLHNLRREDIFITSTLPPDDLGDERAIRSALCRTLQSLNTSYIDLYLLNISRDSAFVSSKHSRGVRRLTWRTLISLKREGRIKSLGVYNFSINMIQEVTHYCSERMISVNRIAFNPFSTQEVVVNYCRSRGIHVQAHTLFGRRYTSLHHPVIINAARELNVTPARFLYNWAFQQNIGVITKGIHKEDILNNARLNFIISRPTMINIRNLTH